MSEESNTNANELQESDNQSLTKLCKNQEQAEKLPKRVLLVPYPKFVFMYPTLIVSTIAALVLGLGGYQAVDPQEHTLAVVITGLFFVVLMINTFILVFDFPRATSLTLIAVCVSASPGFVDFADRKTLAPTGHRGSGNDGPTCRECFLFHLHIDRDGVPLWQYS